jgi:hypothetical protein
MVRSELRRPVRKTATVKLASWPKGAANHSSSRIGNARTDCRGFVRHAGMRQSRTDAETVKNGLTMVRKSSETGEMHEIQVLRRAEHSQADVARTGVSWATVCRVERETVAVHVDDRATPRGTRRVKGHEQQRNRRSLRFL